jgi:hypothetical protein
MFSARRRALREMLRPAEEGGGMDRFEELVKA